MYHYHASYQTTISNAGNVYSVHDLGGTLVQGVTGTMGPQALSNFYIGNSGEYTSNGGTDIAVLFGNKNVAGPYRNPLRLFIGSLHQIYDITNPGNAPVKLWLYVATPKIANTAGPGGDFDNTTFWSGEIPAGQATDKHRLIFNGMKSYENSTFNGNWKIIRRKFIEIEPGRCFKYSYVHHYNRCVTYFEMQNFLSAYIPTKSRAVFCKIQGCVAPDTTTNTNVGISPAILSYMVSYHVTGRPITGVYPYVSTNDLMTVTCPAPVYNMITTAKTALD